MIWQPEIETASRDAITQLQTQRLNPLCNRVYDRVPFYKKQWDQQGINPKDIQTLDDLQKLPFTVKSDLRDHYPFGLFALPLSEVTRIHASSGTTGKPTVVGYSREDLSLWADVCARCLALSGATPGQMFQNAYGYGLFTGGLGMHYGAEKMGLTVVPVSGGNTARQLLLLQDFGTEVLACTPSYALTLADRIQAEGIKDLKLKTLILGAEPWTNEMRLAIEEKLGVQAVNIYGLSEIIGPGVSNECVEAKDGSHICEDHFLVEAIDPDTSKPVAEGQVGELVFTTLTKQAMPLIRYRTGDMATLNRQPCICGRTHTRMSAIKGRVDDMLIIKGVNVFPSQIETVILECHELSPHHQIVVSKEAHLDHIHVHCEVQTDFDRSQDQALIKKVKQRCSEILGLNIQVTLCEPETLPRSEGGKLNRVKDIR